MNERRVAARVLYSNCANAPDSNGIGEAQTDMEAQ